MYPRSVDVIAVAARCTISGAAHGYLFEGELVQTIHGRLMRRRRNEFGPPLDKLNFEPVAAELDLRLELERLRVASPLVRPDHRIAHLELRVGKDTVSLQYPRPLVGDVPTDHPADRLYAALWDWPTA